MEVSAVPFLETNAGSSGFAGDGSISVTLTDPEVLDCPICCEPLTTPVLQCVNGHISCFKCCTKITNRCPFCFTQVGYSRCRAIEKVLESIKVSCKNRNYGCRDSFIYSTRHKHEEVCAYTPCSCPFSDCSFNGSWKLLSLHISFKHYKSVRRFKYKQSICFNLGADQRLFLFQEVGDGSLFILNNVEESLGNAVFVSRIGPPARGSCHYELVAKGIGSLLRLQSFTNTIQKRVEGLPLNSFLLIPSQFLESSLGYKMELCISGCGVLYT